MAKAMFRFLTRDNIDLLSVHLHLVSRPSRPDSSIVSCIRASLHVADCSCPLYPQSLVPLSPVLSFPKSGRFRKTSVTHNSPSFHIHKNRQAYVR